MGRVRCRGDVKRTGEGRKRTGKGRDEPHGWVGGWAGKGWMNEDERAGRTVRLAMAKARGRERWAAAAGRTK